MVRQFGNSKTQKHKTIIKQLNMKDYKIHVLDKISISPSSVSFTQQISKQYKNSLGQWVFKESKPCVKNGEHKKENTLQKKWHNMEISKNSQRNLRQKIEYLFLYAKPRRIRTYNNKILANFKVVFLTLKLPSKQVHNTSTIITECLQPLFELFRKRLNMVNYVYRVEFQKNGNVHFHICTDTYIDYYFALKHWNRLLEKLGYISAFAEQMNKLSLAQYAEKYGKNYLGEKLDFKIVKNRYENGVKKKWKNPNSVDVKNARGGDNIGLYISKYFSKKDGAKKMNELDNEENTFALRLCYWSRSLSRLKPESMPTDYYDIAIMRELAKDESVIICYYDYCTVIYFDYKKLKGLAKYYLELYFEQERVLSGYLPAV